MALGSSRRFLLSHVRGLFAAWRPHTGSCHHFQHRLLPNWWMWADALSMPDLSAGSCQHGCLWHDWNPGILLMER